jgi:hypothetical protein
MDPFLPIDWPPEIFSEYDLPKWLNNSSSIKVDRFKFKSFIVLRLSSISCGSVSDYKMFFYNRLYIIYNTIDSELLSENYYYTPTFLKTS